MTENKAPIAKVSHISINVSDLDESIAFYDEAFEEVEARSAATAKPPEKEETA